MIKPANHRLVWQQTLKAFPIHGKKEKDAVADVPPFPPSFPHHQAFTTTLLDSLKKTA